MKKKITSKEAGYILSKMPDVFANILTGASSQNEIRELKGGHISYNPYTDVGKETALCFGGEFFILLGDYRKDLKKCKTIAECKKVYRKLIKDGAEISCWSTVK